MQSIWEILGVEQTDDVARIKTAYAEKIKTVHPEDDPEGFKNLQTAYRTAIEIAKNRQNQTSGQFGWYEMEDDVVEVEWDGASDSANVVEDILAFFEQIKVEEQPDDLDSFLDVFQSGEVIFEGIPSNEEIFSNEIEQRQWHQFGETFEELEAGEAFVRAFKEYVGWIAPFDKVLQQLNKEEVDGFFEFEHIRQQLEEKLLNTYMVGDWDSRLGLVQRCQQLRMMKAADYIKLVGFTSFEYQEGQETVLEGWKNDFRD